VVALAFSISTPPLVFSEPLRGLLVLAPLTLLRSLPFGYPRHALLAAGRVLMR